MFSVGIEAKRLLYMYIYVKYLLLVFSERQKKTSNKNIIFNTYHDMAL